MIHKPELIKNIIFDFGDIFINLDKEATLRELDRFGFHQPTPRMQQLAMEYEKGLVSSQTFEQELSNLIPSATANQIKAAWNAILKDIPAGRLQFLSELKRSEQYRLFLLSNTNEWHIQFVEADMGPASYADFREQFEHFYLSYEMGMRKPDAEIYQRVLLEQDLSAEHTLFIDDTLENIESAMALGLQTWHLQVGKEDITELSKHLSHG